MKFELTEKLTKEKDDEVVVTKKYEYEDSKNGTLFKLSIKGKEQTLAEYGDMIELGAD